MATPRTTSTRGAHRRLGAGLAAAALLAFGSLIAISANPATTAARAAAAATESGSYGWPVKPFDKPHPIRGSFGDPRTLFRSPPTMDGLLTSNGSFSFHQGVDISAPTALRSTPS